MEKKCADVASPRKEEAVIDRSREQRGSPACPGGREGIGASRVRVLRPFGSGYRPNFPAEAGTQKAYEFINGECRQRVTAAHLLHSDVAIVGAGAAGLAAARALAASSLTSVANGFIRRPAEKCFNARVAKWPEVAVGRTEHVAVDRKYFGSLDGKHDFLGVPKWQASRGSYFISQTQVRTGASRASNDVGRVQITRLLRRRPRDVSSTMSGPLWSMRLTSVPMKHYNPRQASQPRSQVPRATASSPRCLRCYSGRGLRSWRHPADIAAGGVDPGVPSVVVI